MKDRYLDGFHRGMKWGMAIGITISLVTYFILSKIIVDANSIM